MGILCSRGAARRASSLWVCSLAALIFGGNSTVALADQVFVNDLIVQGSIGVGFDATNGMSFGFDTIILRENNVRMLYDDTSTSASFPRNDWRIIANDSTNGGGNYYAIEDATAGRQVFRVDAGAPANALRIDSGGDVGIGTSTPVVDLHVKTGNTPTLRLEQDGSSGFTAQSWDLAGNETNFFIRDVTNGSQLPFRIRPGAATSSIDISSSGLVGLGDASPDAHLEVSANGTTGGNALIVSSNDGNDGDLLTVTESGLVGIGEVAPTTRLSVNSGISNTVADFQSTDPNAEISLSDSNTTGPGFVGLRATSNDMIFLAGGSEKVRILSAGQFGIRTVSPAHPLQIGDAGGGFGNAAHCTTGGVFTNGSSREFKKDIANLDPETAMAALRELQPVTYEYKVEPDEQYVGFIAEDVPEVVATRGRKHLAAMDIVAVLTSVVQQQQEQIDDLRGQIRELQDDRSDQ